MLGWRDLTICSKKQTNQILYVLKLSPCIRDASYHEDLIILNNYWPNIRDS